MVFHPGGGSSASASESNTVVSGTETPFAFFQQQQKNLQLQSGNDEALPPSGKIGVNSESFGCARLMNSLTPTSINHANTHDYGVSAGVAEGSSVAANNVKRTDAATSSEFAPSSPQLGAAFADAVVTSLAPPLLATSGFNGSPRQHASPTLSLSAAPTPSVAASSPAAFFCGSATQQPSASAEASNRPTATATSVGGGGQRLTSGEASSPRFASAGANEERTALAPASGAAASPAAWFGGGSGISSSSSTSPRGGASGESATASAPSKPLSRRPSIVAMASSTAELFGGSPSAVASAYGASANGEKAQPTASPASSTEGASASSSKPPASASMWGASPTHNPFAVPAPAAPRSIKATEVLSASSLFGGAPSSSSSGTSASSAAVVAGGPSASSRASGSARLSRTSEGPPSRSDDADDGLAKVPPAAVTAPAVTDTASLFAAVESRQPPSGAGNTRASAAGTTGLLFRTTGGQSDKHAPTASTAELFAAIPDKPSSSASSSLTAVKSQPPFGGADVAAASSLFSNRSTVPFSATSDPSLFGASSSAAAWPPFVDTTAAPAAAVFAAATEANAASSMFGGAPAASQSFAAASAASPTTFFSSSGGAAAASASAQPAIVSPAEVAHQAFSQPAVALAQETDATPQQSYSHYQPQQATNEGISGGVMMEASFSGNGYGYPQQQHQQQYEGQGSQSQQQLPGQERDQQWPSTAEYGASDSQLTYAYHNPVDSGDSSGAGWFAQQQEQPLANAPSGFAPWQTQPEQQQTADGLSNNTADVPNTFLGQQQQDQSFTQQQASASDFFGGGDSAGGEEGGSFGSSGAAAFGAASSFGFAAAGAAHDGFTAWDGYATADGFFSSSALGASHSEADRSSGGEASGAAGSWFGGGSEGGHFAAAGAGLAGAFGGASNEAAPWDQAPATSFRGSAPTSSVDSAPPFSQQAEGAAWEQNATSSELPRPAAATNAASTGPGPDPDRFRGGDSGFFSSSGGSGLPAASSSAAAAGFFNSDAGHAATTAASNAFGAPWAPSESTTATAAAVPAPQPWQLISAVQPSAAGPFQQLYPDSPVDTAAAGDKTADGFFGGGGGGGPFGFKSGSGAAFVEGPDPAFSSSSYNQTSFGEAAAATATDASDEFGLSQPQAGNHALFAPSSSKPALAQAAGGGPYGNGSATSSAPFQPTPQPFGGFAAASSSAGAGGGPFGAAASSSAAAAAAFSGYQPAFGSSSVATSTAHFGVSSSASSVGSSMAAPFGAPAFGHYTQPQQQSNRPQPGVRRCSAAFGFGGRLVVIQHCKPASESDSFDGGISGGAFGAFSSSATSSSTANVPVVTLQSVSDLLASVADSTHAAMTAWPGPLAAAPSSSAVSSTKLQQHFSEHAAFYLSSSGASDSHQQPQQQRSPRYYGSVGRSDQTRDAKLLWRVLLALADNDGSLAPRGASALTTALSGSGGDQAASAATTSGGGSNSARVADGPDTVSASLVSLLLDGEQSTSTNTDYVTADHNAPCSGWEERPELTKAIAALPHSSSLSSSSTPLNGMRLLPDSDLASLQSAGAAIESLVARGQRREALAEAIRAGLWQFALLVATSLGPQAFAETVRSMSSSTLPPSSPLFTAFSMYCGLQPPITRPLALPIDGGGESESTAAHYAEASSLLKRWRSHAAVLVSHRRPGAADGATPAALASLGDRLWLEGGSVSAAHALYLIAGATLEPVVPTSRLVLPGYDHRRHGLGSALLRAVAPLQLAELIELGRRRGNSQAVLPALQPYKLAYAALACDYGLLKVAAAYVVHIRAVVRDAGPSAFPPAFLAQLDALEGRLKNCGRPLGGAGGSLAGSIIAGTAASAAHAVGSAFSGLKRIFLGSGADGGSGSVAGASGSAPSTARGRSGSISRAAVVAGGTNSSVATPRGGTAAAKPPLPPSTSATGASASGSGHTPPASARSRHSAHDSATAPDKDDDGRHSSDDGPGLGGSSSGGGGGSHGMGERRKSIIDLTSSLGSGLLSSISLRGIFTPRTSDDGKPVYRANLPSAGKEAQPYYDEASGRWVFPGEEASSEPPPPTAPPTSLPPGMMQQPLTMTTSSTPMVGGGAGSGGAPFSLSAAPPGSGAAIASASSSGTGSGVPPLPPGTGPVAGATTAGGRKGGRALPRYVDTFNKGGGAGASQSGGLSMASGGAPAIPSTATTMFNPSASASTSMFNPAAAAASSNGGSGGMGGSSTPGGGGGAAAAAVEAIGSGGGGGGGGGAAPRYALFHPAAPASSGPAFSQQ